MSQPIRIGEILVEHGVLTEQQVFEVVQAQKKFHLPFGVLAERMFEVTLDSVERAWIEQYHRFTGTIDLSQHTCSAQVLSLLSRRQAWQFEVLPVQFEPTGELLMAASRQRLARAVTFAAQHLDHEVYFRIAESAQLRLFLQKYYPMAGAAEHLVRESEKYEAGSPEA